MKQTVTRRVTTTGVSPLARAAMRTPPATVLVTLVATVLLAFGASSAAAQGGGRCLAPNGVDDTTELQAALDGCSGGSSGCSVRLCAGVFHTAPLRVGDFRGTLRGAGAGATVLRALPDLTVNDRLDGYWHDDPLDRDLAPWPYLLQFVEGRGTVRDLTVDVPTPEPGLRPTRGWTEIAGVNFELAGAILVTGRAPERFTVRRVEVTAGPDPDSFLDTTLFYGVAVRGLLFDDTGDPNGFPVFPVSGRHTIRDCRFTGMLTGVNLGELADARVTVRGNRTSAFVALDLFDAARSRVQVQENAWGVTSVGVNVFLNIDGSPSVDNTIVISNNRGATGADEGFGEGVFFIDPWILPEPGNSTVTAFGNELEIGSASEPGAAGVTLIGAGRALVATNELRGGVGTAGLTIDDTARCRLFFNDFTGLETGEGPDLLLGPGTSECLALLRRQDTYVDDGTDNRILQLF